MSRRPPHLKRSRLVLVLVGLLLLPAVLYYRSSHLPPGGLTWSGRISVFLLDPIFHQVSRFKNGVSSVFHHYFFLVRAAKENESLKSRLQEYLLEEIRREEIESENERLNSLLGFQKRLPFRTIAAQVISFSPTGEFQMLTVNRGKEEGVIRGGAVISEKEVVGRVIKAYPHESQVLLLSDPTSAVDTETKRTGARGLVVGHGITIGLSREIFVGAFELWEGFQEVADDDILITSGMDGVFPKGLPIGKVKNVRKTEADVFLNGEVLPFVDYNKLKEVLIILP